MDQHDLGELSAADTARLVNAGEVKPTEIIDAAIARIERRNPSLNALVHTDFGQARERAHHLEQQQCKGEAPGMLAGVPMAMQDLFGHYPGWPATLGGVPQLANHLATSRSLFPQRMENAGAVIVGTANSSTLGFRGTCDNELFGCTRNPFDPAFNSGGSSGGSAAAVADGMLPAAGTNDGGGTAGIAAAWSGVFAFQPSQELVPELATSRASDQASPYVRDGVVTRTVQDAALMLSALTKDCETTSPLSAAPTDWMMHTLRSIKSLRIGLSLDLGVFPVDSRIAEVVRHAAIVFECLGAQVKMIDFPLSISQQQLSEIWCRLMGSRMLATIENFQEQGIDLLGKPAQLPLAVRTWIDRSRGITLTDMHAAEAARSSIHAAFDSSFEQVDVLLAPTVGSLPVRNAARGMTMGPDDVEGEAVDPLIGWALTCLTHYTGHPAAFVPAGNWDGMPIGMQLIGRRGGDGDLLAASAAYEQSQPWMASYRIPRQRRLDRTDA